MKAKPSASGKKSATRKKSASTADQAEAKEEKRAAKVLETVLSEVTAAPEQEHIEEDVAVECPYCGEGFEVKITSEQDGQSIYEDCQVCSRSFSLHIQIEEGELNVEAYRS